MTIDADRLAAIEAGARDHLLRCRATEMRMIDPHHKRTVHPGIVPELCEIILLLVEELRALRARGRGR